MDFTGYRHRETTEPTGARSSSLSPTPVCCTTGRGVSHLWIFRIENSGVSIPPKSPATKTDIPPPARRNPKSLAMKRVLPVLAVFLLIALLLAAWTLTSPPILETRSASELSNSVFSSARSTITDNLTDGAAGYLLAFGYAVGSTGIAFLKGNLTIGS